MDLPLFARAIMPATTSPLATPRSGFVQPQLMRSRAARYSHLMWAQSADVFGSVHLCFQVATITLSAAKQFEVAAETARRGLGGTKVYDLLTLRCAAKAGAERVYALDLQGFTRLAAPELRERLGAVS